MKIKPFKVEEWMNEYETGARWNIAETCVDSVSMDELFELTGTDKKAFLDELCAKRMTYGDIEGSPAFREGVCRLYKNLAPENIVPTHGASGANHHVFYSLLEPGDRVISIMPTYQQLYSIPESLGAQVTLLRLTAEEGFHPDMKKLRSLASEGVRMICVNNPNNPTGALIDNETLAELASIAREEDAWLLCDEVYRHLTQKVCWSDSVADIYEKGISVSGMSKVFSLAGIRLGWIATRDRKALRSILSHRDYDLVSCGIFDEAAGALALTHQEKLLERNRTVVRTNLAILDHWVHRQPHVSYTKPQAGTTALIFYDLDIPSRAFCAEMYEATGAFVTPGDCFEEEYSFRIGYACDAETLRQGLAAIDEYIAAKTAG